MIKRYRNLRILYFTKDSLSQAKFGGHEGDPGDMRTPKIHKLVKFVVSFRAWARGALHA